MRIALFNIDCVATNTAIRSFLQRHRDEVVFVGLSPPFRVERGGVLRQSIRHMRRSGSAFSNFLGCNFMFPRLMRIVRRVVPIGGRMPPTIAEECTASGIEVREIVDVNDAAVAEALVRLDVDVIVSCFFDQFFKSEMLALARRGAINVHTSLLPLHRGPMPVIYSALDRPPTFGVSIHLINQGIDGGPILAQEAYRPAPGESILQSIAQLHDRGLEMLSEMLPAIAAGAIEPHPQAGGTYESFPTRSVIRQLRRQGTRLMTWSDIKRAYAMSIET